MIVHPLAVFAYLARARRDNGTRVPFQAEMVVLLPSEPNNGAIRLKTVHRGLAVG